MSEAPTADLAEQVAAFAATLDSLVEECLPNSPGVEVRVFGDRYGVTPLGQTEKRGGIPLSVQGDILAWLRFNYFCRLDVTNQYLAVDKSKV